MHRRRYLIFPIIVLIFASAFAWQLPSVLKVIPSRYVARLPQPLQQLGEREHVDVLPTTAPPENVAKLLDDSSRRTESYRAEALYYKGLAQIALGDLSSARRNLKDAIDFHPNYPAAVEALVQLNS